MSEDYWKKDHIQARIEKFPEGQVAIKVDDEFAEAFRKRKKPKHIIMIPLQTLVDAYAQYKKHQRRNKLIHIPIVVALVIAYLTTNNTQYLFPCIIAILSYIFWVLSPSSKEKSLSLCPHCNAGWSFPLLIASKHCENCGKQIVSDNSAHIFLTKYGHTADYSLQNFIDTLDKFKKSNVIIIVMIIIAISSIALNVAIPYGIIDNLLTYLSIFPKNTAKIFAAIILFSPMWIGYIAIFINLRYRQKKYNIRCPSCKHYFHPQNLSIVISSHACYHCGQNIFSDTAITPSANGERHTIMSRQHLTQRISEYKCAKKKVDRQLFIAMIASFSSAFLLYYYKFLPENIFIISAVALFITFIYAAWRYKKWDKNLRKTLMLFCPVKQRPFQTVKDSSMLSHQSEIFATGNCPYCGQKMLSSS